MAASLGTTAAHGKLLFGKVYEDRYLFFRNCRLRYSFIVLDRHGVAVTSATRPHVPHKRDTLRQADPKILSRKFSAEPSDNFVELALHGDHLFAHVQGNFSAFKIDTHLLHEQSSDTNSINLVERVNFLTAPDGRKNNFLAFELRDELDIDAADFGHFLYP